MKKKLFAGMAIATLGLATPVLGQSVTDTLVTTEAIATTAPEVNPILADVKAGNAKRFEYELEAVAYFLFIPITGKANFNVNLDGDTYSARTVVKTTGIADIFVDYDMQIASSGYILDDGVQTYSYVSQNNDGKKNRRVEMTFGSTDVTMKANPMFGDLGNPPATPEQKLEALDPVAALIDIAFQPRSADNPCGETIKTFDGKQLTHLETTYKGKKNIRTKAFKGEATECYLKLRRVAGYNGTDKGENLSGVEGDMRIYFAEPIDGLMPVIRLEVDTDDLGTVTLSTTKLKIHDVVKTEASTGQNSG